MGRKNHRMLPKSSRPAKPLIVAIIDNSSPSSSSFFLSFPKLWDEGSHGRQDRPFGCGRRVWSISGLRAGHDDPAPGEI